MAKALKAMDLDAAVALLPHDRPFTYQQAIEAGVNRDRLRLLCKRRRVERKLPGVYRLPGVKDSLETRLECLALFVPHDCVVTDYTAAWIWCGDRALPPNAHLAPPAISVFAPPGRRLRNGLVDSGERRLVPTDVVMVGGLLVTTPLRTACDLGRLLHVDSAFAAMDALASLRVFTVDELVAELDRFKGYRGIVQARTWAPYVDPRSDSWLESVARRRWLCAGLPTPDCQVPVPAPDGGWFYVDFGLPEDLFGCEVFGEKHHGEAEAPHDEGRLLWLREARTWRLVVARNRHITGQHQDLEHTLRREWHEHRGAARAA